MACRTAYDEPVERRTFASWALWGCAALAAGAQTLLAGCDGGRTPVSEGSPQSAPPSPNEAGLPEATQPEGRVRPPASASAADIDFSREEHRGFTVDNVYHSPEGDISYCSYVPADYDAGEPHALYVALPGWEGLRFQGAGENLHEEFPFEAQRYDADMVVVSPQLNDWGHTSAEQAIALTERMMGLYNIDPGRVYLSGYSGGGETGSIVMGLSPGLFAAYLHASSQWDGDVSALVKSRVPVRLVVGESDEYYGSELSERAYAEIAGAYSAAGLSQGEIDGLVMLDVKPAGYFSSRGVSNQHGGGAVLFAQDEEIMGWLFGHEE